MSDVHRFRRRTPSPLRAVLRSNGPIGTCHSKRHLGAHDPRVNTAEPGFRNKMQRPAAAPPPAKPQAVSDVSLSEMRPAQHALSDSRPSEAANRRITRSRKAGIAGLLFSVYQAN